uniref:Uncharacterized protein n=1 Tax=Arundo donax TaxID=35708 RepID=A0A0A9AVY1_ARUDO
MKRRRKELRHLPNNKLRVNQAHCGPGHVDHLARRSVAGNAWKQFGEEAWSPLISGRLRCCSCLLLMLLLNVLRAPNEVITRSALCVCRLISSFLLLRVCRRPADEVAWNTASSLGVSHGGWIDP